MGNRDLVPLTHELFITRLCGTVGGFKAFAIGTKVRSTGLDPDRP